MKILYICYRCDRALFDTILLNLTVPAIGIKNKGNKLVIYADKIPAFNRVYWANWFGQKDSLISPLKDNIFITNYGQKIIINKNNYCKDAEIYINLNYKAKCKGSLITINKDFLRKSPVILIFCNKKECMVKSTRCHSRVGGNPG